MAFHKHFKLPPYKLTQRCGAATKVRSIHRGDSAQYDRPVQSTSVTEERETCSEPSQCIPSFPCRDGHEVSLCNEEEPLSSPEEPTLHELQSKASVKGWSKLGMGMLLSAVNTSAMPSNQLCLVCCEPATLRCQQCGPLIHYCYECFSKQHEKVNFFHVPEKWEVDCYKQFHFDNKRINVRPLHCCETLKESTLQCLDERVRARLWPASPHYPRYAFSFDLLDWAESLLLECQVALKDFCQALYFRCPFQTLKRRDVYSCLIDSFEEYRYFKHEMRHLSFLAQGLDAGNVCPACPKGNGKVVYALDALFGLPRKRAAGESVDEFVTEENDMKQSFQDCNNFLAGNMLRSSTRYKALEETAVFGSACRHEFPALFLNLKHGERLAYSVWLIDQLIDRHSPECDKPFEVYVMYDIACTLQKNLERHGRSDILEKVHLSLPSFHSYGHKASCQIQFGPMRCEGIGLSDGETMERLWSYLRRFGKMTKEMRPAHRTDVLAHALAYYGMKTKAKLGKLLMLRWKRTQQIHVIAQETFHKLAKDGQVLEETVRLWVTEEAAIVAEHKIITRGSLPAWKSEYFILLQSYINLREKLTQACLLQQQKLSLCQEVSRLNVQLEELERKYHIPHRWAPNDSDYVQVLDSFSTEKKTYVAEALWATSARRQFLLKLKAKYAEGQKIAKKLSIQIIKETQKLKALLQEYNAYNVATTGDCSTLSFADVVDSSKLAQIVNPNSSYSIDKQELIEAYLLLIRSGEEIHMLECDMKNVISYYENRVNMLTVAMESPSEVARKCKSGARALFQNLLQEANQQLHKCRQLFSSCLHQDQSPQLNDSDSDLSSEAYTDSDSESDI